MKQATINIIRCILKQEECMTPPMIRRFIDWIQMSEHQHRMNVSQDRVMSVAATCALLKCSPSTAARLREAGRIFMVCGSGSRGIGYRGREVMQLITGLADRAKFLQSKRKLRRAAAIREDVGANRYRIRQVSAKTIFLIEMVLSQESDYNPDVALEVIKLLQHDIWRFSIPKDFYCVLTRSEICRKLDCGISTVTRLVHAGKILPIIGCGERAMGYSGPSAWQYLLERDGR